MRRFEAKDVAGRMGSPVSAGCGGVDGARSATSTRCHDRDEECSDDSPPQIGGPESAPWEVDHDISVTNDCEDNAPHRRSISLRTASIFGRLQPATDLRASPQTVRKCRMKCGL